MKIKKSQMHRAQIVITGEDLTADQIREAADRWPEHISSECSALALGLPEEHTRGGLPLYSTRVEMFHAREYIARLISKCWNEGSKEHTTEIEEG